MDNPLMRALSIVGDLILLNILTALCCIPVITWGAALTALNDVAWNIVNNTEGYIIRSYFRSFRKNLKTGSILGIIYAVCAMIFIVDVYAVSGKGRAIVIALIAVGIIFVAVVNLSFALLFHYGYGVIEDIKMSLYIMVGFFPVVFAMSVWNIFYAALSYYFSIRLIPAFILLGISLPCYVNALIYSRIFEKIDGEKAPLDDA